MNVKGALLIIVRPTMFKYEYRRKKSQGSILK